METKTDAQGRTLARVRLWATPEELDSWKWMAEKAQMPLATWIKRRLNRPETEAATKPVRL